MFTMQETQSKNKGADNRPNLDWDGFKQKQFAVICETDKEQFFEDCKKHGILICFGDMAKKRNLFVCAKRYESRFSDGRYELFALKGWETKPNGLYGKDGLQEVVYRWKFCL